MNVNVLHVKLTISQVKIKAHVNLATNQILLIAKLTQETE